MKKIKHIAAVTALVLSISVSASPFSSPQQPWSKLTINQAFDNHKVYSMELIAINGNNISDRGDVVWLKPGDYDLTFNAKVNKKYTNGRLAKAKTGNNDIYHKVNMSLKEGKTYFMSYETEGKDAHNWKPMVYKIE